MWVSIVAVITPEKTETSVTVGENRVGKKTPYYS